MGSRRYKGSESIFSSLFGRHSLRKALSRGTEAKAVEFHQAGYRGVSIEFEANKVPVRGEL